MNAFGKKNFIGTFAVPWAVINDFELLESLTPRDKRAGYIEAVKVACIRDAAFFDSIERDATKLRDFEPEAMQQLIRRCAELHVNHIATSGDPFELGSARPLDFGHWSAHKLESLSRHEVRHGEAVAIGVALDLHAASRLGLITAAERDRVVRIMERCGLKLWHPLLAERGEGGELRIRAGLEEFRQHLGGRLTLTLPSGLGSKVEVHELPAALVEEAVAWLEGRAAAASQPARV
jgi:3-dehydroquinate synthase